MGEREGEWEVNGLESKLNVLRAQNIWQENRNGKRRRKRRCADKFNSILDTDVMRLINVLSSGNEQTSCMPIPDECAIILGEVEGTFEAEVVQCSTERSDGALG